MQVACWMTLLIVLQLEPLKERQPTQLQHPKYDVDSLLNCPHDQSHAGGMVEYKTPQTTLLGKIHNATVYLPTSHNIENLFTNLHII